ncbi:MAG: S28 family serine protease [Bacteroidota bacterium]
MHRVACWILLFVVWLPANASAKLDEFLERIDVVEVRVLEGESIYETILEVLVEQPLDHRNPDGESFMQRIYISHIDPSMPVVFVTEGYDANYYYTHEIAAKLKCNQIMAEHRYFGKSQPDHPDLQYLDTWQAASDLHRVVQLFKELYPGQWIATGISKGGQEVMYHSYYYPDDVDVRVAYVAPLNHQVEDERIYAFLDQVGTASARKKIKHFQKLALKHEERYIPAFRQFSEEKGYTYEIAGGLERAYEYCVLEYSFAFWQWGYVPVKMIPGRAAGPREFVEHMNRVAGFDYFDDAYITEFRPFFYQALTEMGYYGYKLDEFEPYIRHVDNPVFTFTLPEGLDVTFNPELSVQLEAYLASEADRFIYIYGEYDTWSATAVTSTGNTNSRIFIKEGGSHRTRINNMPPEQRDEVYQTIQSYLSLQ